MTTGSEVDRRPTLHDAPAVDSFRRRLGIDPDRVRRMRYALYRQAAPVESALRNFGIDAAQRAAGEFNLEPLTLFDRRDSATDFSSKLALRAADGAMIEAVILRASTGRSAVCISTQVGCGAGCPFCATGRMGLARNLTSPEIIEQVLVAGRLLREEGRRVRNVVFMGMGEPLDNEPALYDAIDLLIADQGLALTPRRLLVSTVGVPDAMIRLADRRPDIHVALSLHSARPELRERLVPWTRRFGWNELRDALRYVAERHATHRHQGPVMIEHILIDGVNDGPEDVAALIDYLDVIRAHINLIPYNPIAGAPRWKPTPRARRDEIAAELRRAGFFTTIRYSMGADIQAACGQLAQPQPVP